MNYLKTILLLLALLTLSCGNVSERFTKQYQELDFACKENTHCKIFGKCTFVVETMKKTKYIGECKIKYHKDCKMSHLCRAYGECFADRALNKCTVMLDDDCQNSAVCRHFGECYNENQNCVPVYEQDCYNSVICKEDDHCFLKRKRGQKNECVTLKGLDD